jgi:hypothetical protein
VGGSALASLNAALPSDVTTYYTVTIAAGTGTPSYVITATPQGPQVPDGNLTLDSDGNKTRNGATGW